MLKWSFFCFLILWIPQLYAQGSCREYFHSSQTHSVPFTEWMSRIDKGIKELSSVDDFKATNQELKEFNNSESSYKALQTFDRQGAMSTMQFWMIAMQRAFPDVSLETRENVRRAEKLYDRFAEIFNKLPKFHQLQAQAKKAKLERSSKLAMIQILKMHSAWLSVVLGKEINLLKQKDLLELFNAQTRNEFSSEVRRQEDAYEDFLLRVNPFMVKEIQRRSYDVYSELNLHFFGARNAQAFSVSDRGFFLRNATMEEVLPLLEALRLPRASLEKYKRDMEILRDQFPKTEAGARDTHRYFALMLMRAAEEVYGERISVGASWFQRGMFHPSAYMALKRQIENAETVRAIIEEQIANYVSRSDSFNARLQEVRDGMRYIEVHSPEAQDQIENLHHKISDLEVKDFGADMDFLDKALFQIEVQLDLIRETAASLKQKESILDFLGLNNRWQRLLPNKTYRIAGVDYKGVRFSPEVVDYFAHNPLLGSRYLAALGKSYVAVLGESGLRRLPSIHPDMRDIKIIRSHGKIRLVGRLINGTIHFFHVYASEKPYDNRRMEQVIEHYHP